MNISLRLTNVWQQIKNEEKNFFLTHIKNLNMIEKENNKYPPPTLINDIKNERLKEKLLKYA